MKTLADFGAKIDGQTDDLAALNSYIAYYQGLVSDLPAGIQGTGFIFVDMPPGVMLISGPPEDTGDYNLMIRGAGQGVSIIKMESGASGLWIHGTTTSPSTGILQIRDISFLDGNSAGTGVPAIQCSFSEDSTRSANTLTLDNVEFRSFTTCMKITDMPRNCYATNVLCYGPDDTFQAGGAFEISSTASSAFGNFTWVWTRVMVTNYEWGWDYQSITPMEGHRWYSCTCYNGWGMIRAAIQNTVNGYAEDAYQSPIWYINDCDWQGLGFALDLYNARNVIVRGGFYFCNSLSGDPVSGDTIPNDPRGDTRDHRSVMAFYSCGNITLDGVEFDNGGNSMIATDTFVYVANDVTYFRAFNTIFLAPIATAGAFEYEAGGANNRCGAFDTQWVAFGGSTKILDHDDTQMNQEAVFDPQNSRYYGNQDRTGLYRIHDIVTSLISDSQNRVTITFPTRPSGHQIFNGGTPVVTVQPLNGSDNSAAPAVTLVNVTNEGFTFEYQGEGGGYQADVHYTANGF